MCVPSFQGTVVHTIFTDELLKNSMQPPQVFSIVWVVYVLVKSDSVVGSPSVSSRDGIPACLSLTSRKYLIEKSYHTA